MDDEAAGAASLPSFLRVAHARARTHKVPIHRILFLVFFAGRGGKQLKCVARRTNATCRHCVEAIVRVASV